MDYSAQLERANGLSMINESAMNAETIAAVRAAVDLRPGPVCNEDLLDLSDDYKQKLIDVKKEMDAHKEASETSINAMREMFCDWSHMSMQKQVMEGLKSAISRKFEAAMGGTDEPVAINCKEAVLMDQ